MTTIAFKGNEFCSDSCWTGEDGALQEVSAVKIKRLSAGALLGQAGDNDAREVEVLFDKIKHPKQLPLRAALRDLRIDFSGLLVFPSGRVFKVACNIDPNDKEAEIGVWECNRGFMAAGSGAHLAIGAMAAGKSAREAVAIACKFDLNSRLPVHTVYLKPAKA